MGLKDIEGVCCRGGRRCSGLFHHGYVCGGYGRETMCEEGIDAKDQRACGGVLGAGRDGVGCVGLKDSHCLLREEVGDLMDIDDRQIGS